MEKNKQKKSKWVKPAMKKVRVPREQTVLTRDCDKSGGPCASGSSSS